MKRRVLVLGGNGFIGRHAVAALVGAGIDVTIGTRHPRARDDGVSELAVQLDRMTAASDWQSVAAGFDTLLNCVGILRQRGHETYERVHHEAPAAMARACAEADTRFVHVSALGLEHPHRSRFLTSKRRGEQAVQDAGGDWMLVRPSLLDGEGGFGAAWLRGVAQLPVFAVPADARGLIAACCAHDIGEALMRLSTAAADALDLSQSRVFELGGTDAHRFKDYIRGLRALQSTGRALGIPIPGLLARLGAHLCDLLHFSPFSFGHWELLRKDNVPTPNRLPELLGRAPRRVIAAATSVKTAS
ncbi:MAG: NAD(P)H-binding protein [Pseudomonadota bacterium]